MGATMAWIGARPGREARRGQGGSGHGLARAECGHGLTESGAEWAAWRGRGRGQGWRWARPGSSSALQWC